MSGLDLHALANGPMIRWSKGNPPRAIARKAVRKPTLPRGHANIPGTGPAGETCKSCAHIYRKDGCSKVYLKCGAARHKWTGGTASDVRAGDAACSEWKSPS